MSKIINKIKEIIENINILSEGKIEDIPSTVPELAKAIKAESNSQIGIEQSVEDIEAILSEGKAMSNINLAFKNSAKYRKIELKEDRNIQVKQVTMDNNKNKGQAKDNKQYKQISRDEREVE